MIIKNAKVFQENGTFESGEVHITGTHFAASAESGEIIDATGCYAIPGLIDMHIHGCAGHNFYATDDAGLEVMTRYLAQHGITATCPTMLTQPEKDLADACRLVAKHKNDQGAAIVGIFLEGPFLSPNKTGAQNPAHIHLPDADMLARLQEAAGGLVKLIGIAPEREGALELIESIGDEIGCSIAHTEANYALASEAFARGARLVTHLYNAMPPFHHRDPGVIGAAMDAEHVRVELITDGVHVHPAVVRATFQMFSDDRIILISDNLAAAGLAEGRYEIGGLAVEVKGRRSVLAGTDTIASSVLNLMDCVRVAVTEMEIPLESAVKCASMNPAKALGVFDQRGSIAPGKVADLVLLNEDLSIRAVFLRGQQL